MKGFQSCWNASRIKIFLLYMYKIHIELQVDYIYKAQKHNFIGTLPV